jgi:aspartyl-tRNA(Asn)/glutamyl-tRNA(Gln) amidotransferase subunit B
MSAPASSDGYEAVIGLEIHVQLRTRTKLFCGDRTEFGAPPNTQVCPVCLGLPGALPVPNARAIELAVRAALGFDCTVHETSIWARKNYFYPDLPKGYQITQFERPLATGGWLDVRGAGTETARGCVCAASTWRKTRANRCTTGSPISRPSI